MGDIRIMTEKTVTLAELAEAYGRKYDTIFRKAKRIFPAESWAKNSAVTEDVARVLIGNVPAPRQAISAPARPRTWSAELGPNGQAFREALKEIQKEFTNEQAPAPLQDRKRRTWVLYILLIAPTVASVHNMFTVTFALSGNTYDAISLTVVLSMSAIGFVWYGVRAWYSIALAAILITYEAFCNLTRVYGGLMGSGTPTGNPTRFVGLVTDIFGTGTHYTAIFLGAFTAFFIAAVQYAAIIEINKNEYSNDYPQP